MTTAQDAYEEAQRRIDHAREKDNAVLDLRIEGLEDIPPGIEDLARLAELYLGNTQITSAEPVAGLTNLTTLYLSDTQIKSAEPLAVLTNLTDLYLSNTQITSAEPLAGLKSLTRLHLNDTQITSAEPLAGLINLTSLFVDNTEITSAEPLAGFKNLTQLSLDNTQITSAEPLAGLTSLTRLYLGNTQITSAEPLAALTSLTTLDLSDTQIKSAEPLAVLTNLTDLYLSNTQITSAEPLAGFTNLTGLYLSGTQITSAEPLAGFTNLTRVDLDNTQIHDLRPIMNLDSLVNDEFPGGLSFKNCTATTLDPELKRLSEIAERQNRTRETLAYLKSLTDWPPVPDLPEDRPTGAHYTVPDDGPITARGDPIGPNDPEQDALQIECREKVRTLIGSIREGDNELAAFVEAAAKYRDLIDRDPTNILATTLWSAANTLRARHEAHQSADEQARLNDMLPPATAAALKDLLETHGIFFLSHPGAAEVERKRREFLSGPRNPDARGAADRLATSLAENPGVLDPEAALPLDLDAKTAAGDGPSAQMAETSLFDRLQNITAAIARKVWSTTKTKTGVSIDAIIGAEVTSWWIANKSLVVTFYRYLETNIPAWLNWLTSLF